MELTKEQTQQMIAERLGEYPEVRKIVSNPEFKSKLQEILAFENIPQEFLPIIENELLVVLTFYAPIGELAQNISESARISPDVSARLVTMIETMILTPIYNELIAFEYQWNKQLKIVPNAQSHITQRPVQEVSILQNSSNTETASSRPLTRDEVLKALVPKRTMPSDIASMEQKDTGSWGSAK